MLWLFTTLLTIAAVAIPIVVVTRIALRVSEVTKKLRDPGGLQQAFAESAAAALRRAGADPKAIAKLAGLGKGGVGERGAVDLRAALQEARIALPKSDPAAPIHAAAPVPSEPPTSFDDPRPPRSTARSARPAPRHALHRTPRPRRQHPPVAPLGGFEAGDRFRLSVPPEISEPHGLLPFNTNWLALAALLGAAAYYLIR